MQKLAETALVICRAHSAGLSLLEEGDQRSNFHWRAIAGAWAPHLGGGTPRDFGPCGTVLDRNTALLFSRPERDFPYFGEVRPLLDEGLLIPFYIKGEAVGTIWVVAHDDSCRFDAEDLRVMTNLGTFAAAAYQNLLSLNATRRIAYIVESSDDAIVSKSLKGVITTWNRGATQLFGYMAEEVIGQSITILIPPDRRDEERAILERIQRGERIDHYETIRRCKDGSLVPISLTVSPVKNGDGKIVGDLIARIRAEPRIEVLCDTEVTALHGDRVLRAITLRNNRTDEERDVETNWLFLCLGRLPNTQWAAEVGIIRDESGYLVTGPDLLKNGQYLKNWTLNRDPYYLETNMPGVFAAGDVRHGSIKRCASAVGEGAMVVAFVHRYLAGG